MKTFLLLVSGMLTAGLLLVVGAALYWKNSSHAPTTLSNVPKAVSTLSAPGDDVIFTGTVNMPPAIKIYKPGDGRYRLNLLYGASLEKSISLDSPGSGVKFPRAFKANIPRKALAEAINESHGNFAVIGFYSPGNLGTVGRSFLYWEPTAILWSNLGNPFDAKSNTIDLGNLSFSIAAPQAYYDKCVGDKVLLQGKITPSPAFAKLAAGKKLAFVVYPENQEIAELPVTIGAAEFDRVVVHSQFVSFANGPVSFSLPWRRSPSSILRPLLVICEPNEDLKSCSLLAFPPKSAAKHQDRVFGLTNKHFERAVCGDSDFNAVNFVSIGRIY